ncbi:MAG: hypothetical protein JJU45_20120 [Acidimicrobiia bacterium]|nr:hypothetical protein [Acidimicrobiia bacterium]
MTVRHARRAVALLTVAAVSLVAAVAGAAPGVDATAAQGQFPEYPAPVDPDLLEITDVAAQAVPGGVVSVGFRLDAPPEATVTVALHPRAGGRILYRQALAGENLGAPTQRYAELPAAELPRDEDGVVRFAFEVISNGAPELTQLLLPEVGVYPLSLTVADPDGDVLDTVVVALVRFPTADDLMERQPLSVATLVDVTGPTAIAPDGSVVLGGDDLGALEATTALLERTDEIPLTVRPTPETLVALARLDTTNGTDLVPRLADAVAGRQVMADTYVPLDLGAWVAADRLDEVDRQFDAGLTAVGDTLSVTPRRSSWLLDATVDPAALDALVARGVTQVVVPAELLDPLSAADFPVTLTQGFDVTNGPRTTVAAVQTDDDLVDLLASSDQPALAANRVLGDLGVLAYDDPSLRRGVVLVAPDDPATHDALGELLTAVATPPAGAEPLFDPATLDRLFDTISNADDPAGDGVLQRSWDFDPPTSLGTFPTQLDAARQLVATYATMVDPAVPDGPLQADELTLVAPDARLAADERRTYLAGADAMVAAGTDVVKVPDQEAVTLTAREATIPLTFTNQAPHSVRVDLALASEKLEFPGGDVIELDLAPGTSRVEIAVQARASGAFPVEANLRSPDGRLELAANTFTVRSTAFSGLGVVLSGVAGAFLALWWGRTIVKVRRRRREGPDEPTGDPTPGDRQLVGH